MANTFSTIIEEAFSMGIQEVLHKLLVAEKSVGKKRQSALSFRWRHLQQTVYRERNYTELYGRDRCDETKLHSNK